MKQLFGLVTFSLVVIFPFTPSLPALFSRSESLPFFGCEYKVKRDTFFTTKSLLQWNPPEVSHSGAYLSYVGVFIVSCKCSMNHRSANPLGSLSQRLRCHWEGLGPPVAWTSLRVFTSARGGRYSTVLGGVPHHHGGCFPHEGVALHQEANLREWERVGVVNSRCSVTSQCVGLRFVRTGTEQSLSKEEVWLGKLV